MDLLKNNVGKIDRIIRVVLGILLIGNVFYALQHPVGWIGVVLLVTGIFGICPLYSLLGLNTKSAGEKMGLNCTLAIRLQTTPLFVAAEVPSDASM